MFREKDWKNIGWRRFPHTRGDVPQASLYGVPRIRFSPHAWGCSARLRASPCRPWVFPTRVGMFRPSPCPPTRRAWFSPHAWGCSVEVAPRAHAGNVFPTRVGMFRTRTRVRSAGWCFPHTRGDVPICLALVMRGLPFSPHAWGCSGDDEPGGEARGVFPTRVGMFRVRRMISSSWCCFPHTRGDVPPAERVFARQERFSPHAWGCSAAREEAADPDRVFPTRVGMFRAARRIRERNDRFPHTRGDVPWASDTLQTAATFSPHAWGCSVLPVCRRRTLRVFPTRVGMFRSATPCAPHSQSFPHTRGDVPRSLSPRTRRGPFSPHAWGCSVHAAARSRYTVVFPTRVGMFRATRRRRAARRCFPHTRGDVPRSQWTISFIISFSPHAWGCSEPKRGELI